MSDVMSMILPGGVPPFVVFSPTSRYYSTPLLTGEIDGQEVRYLDARLLPALDAFVVLTEHLVTEGERPDTVAAQYFGDPEQSWRLCDANLVLHPEQLTATVGRRIRITLPQGLSGGPGA